MLVDLPHRPEARRRALDWLRQEQVAHLVLFQQVKIYDDHQAQRLKARLDAEGAV